MSKIVDVARLAGVSSATVSRVINKSRDVSPELTAKVEAALAELDYALNVPARTLRTRKTRTLGFLALDVGYLYNPFLYEVFQGAEHAAGQAGYSVIIRTITDNPQGQREIIRLFHQNQVDGLIISGAVDGSPTVTKLAEAARPFVLVIRRTGDLLWDYVGLDNHDGMLQVMRYLLGLGHKRIAFICGDQRSSVTWAKLSAYKSGLRERNLPFDPSLVVAAKYMPQSAYEATGELLTRAALPTAIVASTDRMAFGAWQCLSESGFDVPERMSLVGFDDIECASMGRMGLTTVRRPSHEVGEIAACTLIERLEGRTPRQVTEVVLPVQLVVRDTCGPPRLDP